MRTKIDITLDSEVLKEIDEARIKTKQSRSRAIEEIILVNKYIKKDLGRRIKLVENFIKAQKRLQASMKVPIESRKK